MKVKFFTGFNSKSDIKDLEDSIEYFTQDKKVIDIKYTTSDGYNRVMIMYEDKEKDNE